VQKRYTEKELKNMNENGARYHPVETGAKKQMYDKQNQVLKTCVSSFTSIWTYYDFSIVGFGRFIGSIKIISLPTWCLKKDILK
jgi:hypothetical protein